jgi:hypothetical protein
MLIVLLVVVACPRCSPSILVVVARRRYLLSGLSLLLVGVACLSNPLVVPLLVSLLPLNVTGLWWNI